jgi:hypothetical protein
MSKLLLIGSLIGGLGGWVITLATWGDALVPKNFGGLLVIVGGLLCAWLGKSPLKGQQ